MRQEKIGQVVTGALYAFAEWFDARPDTAENRGNPRMLQTVQEFLAEHRVPQGAPLITSWRDHCGWAGDPVAVSAFLRAVEAIDYEAALWLRANVPRDTLLWALTTQHRHPLAVLMRLLTWSTTGEGLSYWENFRDRRGSDRRGSDQRDR